MQLSKCFLITTDEGKLRQPLLYLAAAAFETGLTKPSLCWGKRIYQRRGEKENMPEGFASTCADDTL